MRISIFLMLPLAAFFFNAGCLGLNNAMRPECLPSTKGLTGISSSASLPDYAPHANDFLNRASCFGRPGNDIVGLNRNRSVRLACGTKQEMAEFNMQNKMSEGSFPPPRQWSPVPPDCFHQECPMGRFDYPTGCSAHGGISTCIFLGSWYFAMNVLDVNVRIARPLSGSWEDAAVFNQTGEKRRTIFTLNYTDDRLNDLMDGFPFSATESERSVSMNISQYYESFHEFYWNGEILLGISPEDYNGSFRVIHNRYFMPVRPANSSIEPNSSYCGQLSFPLGGYVFGNNDTLPDWPTICVRECPRGSAYPEADKRLQPVHQERISAQVQANAASSCKRHETTAVTMLSALALSMLTIC